MSKRENFNTDMVIRTNLVFPQAVITGNLIFLSGTPGIDPVTGKLIDENFEKQLIQAFKNIETILEAAGSSLNNIVKTTVFMVAGEDSNFAIINKIYSELFPENAPARSAPQVMPFPGNILVSVECIAIV